MMHCESVVAAQSYGLYCELGSGFSLLTKVVGYCH